MLYDFGPRLLKLRKDKNLTQQMVVERAKGFDPNLRLSDSVLGKYESDLAVPRLTEAAALADVLNVSLDYLTSGEKCNVLSLKELSPEQVQLNIFRCLRVPAMLDRKTLEQFEDGILDAL